MFLTFAGNYRFYRMDQDGFRHKYYQYCKNRNKVISLNQILPTSPQIFWFDIEIAEKIKYVAFSLYVCFAAVTVGPFSDYVI